MLDEQRFEKSVTKFSNANAPEKLQVSLPETTKIQARRIDMEIVAVDGSYIILASNSTTSIYVINIAVISTRERLINSFTRQESFVICEGDLIDDSKDLAECYKLSSREIDQISNLMQLLERKTVLEEAKKRNKPTIFLTDGSLTQQKTSSALTDINNELKKNTNHHFVGISKQSTISTILPGFLDSDILAFNIKEPSIFQIDNVTSMVQFMKGSYFFRCDIISNDKIPAVEAIASQCHPFLGYPLALVEAHALAKQVRDIKIAYEELFIRTIEKLGIKKFPFKLSNLQGERATFHDVLDQMTKVKTK